MATEKANWRFFRVLWVLIVTFRADVFLRNSSYDTYEGFSEAYVRGFWLTKEWQDEIINEVPKLKNASIPSFSASVAAQSTFAAGGGGSWQLLKAKVRSSQL